MGGLGLHAGFEHVMTRSPPERDRNMASPRDWSNGHATVHGLGRGGHDVDTMAEKQRAAFATAFP